MDAGSAQEHIPPPVPIKTYQWEDVRRERMAGVYPWTHLTKGPFDEKEFENNRDHEYEPISPPVSQPSQPISPPLLTVTNQEGQENITEPESKPDSEPEETDFAPKIDRSKHEYLRIPLDRDLIIPIDKAEIESIRYDDEEEAGNNNDQEMTAQDIQDRIEERIFSATPTTTISRTDGEFNTSQMDSSGLDELPLKRDARKGFNTKGFQQRIQSQAGRLRTRIRNISRPKISMPERPKFNLPERPKFNFPERPKFNIKKPDLKMPNFNFGKTKSSSIRRPLRDRSQIPSNQSTVGSKKNTRLFDSINFSTYPRIFSKKKKTPQGRRAMTPPPRMETESSPPSSPASRTGPVNQRWTQRFKDIKFADDDNTLDIKKTSFDDDVEDDMAPFRDTDYKTAVLLSDKKEMKAESSVSNPGSDREQQSSGSSSERHRAGVIEEIDSDTFFLRPKGLSREDVDVSRYLSLEIHDAFRSSKNALASLDGDLYDDEGYEYSSRGRPSGEPIRLSMEAIRNRSLEQIRMTPERENEYRREEEEFAEPLRPERSRSLKKNSSRSHSEELKTDVEKQFDTYPPNRPTRVRKQSSQSKHSIQLEDYDAHEIETIAKRQPSIPSLAITDTTKELSLSRYIDESSEALNEPWVDEAQPPLPPKRRKSTRDSSLDNESLSARNYKQLWLDDERSGNIILDDNDEFERGLEQNRLVQNGYYDTPPQPPIRKSRSQGTSLADEDRTSRGADSLISETRTHLTEDIPVDIKPEIQSFNPDNFTYSHEQTVIENKPVVIEKPTRPPPPNRKSKTAAQLTALKNQSINFFFTYPRRAIKKTLHKENAVPERQLSNYSSIGPARPPRRNRVFREPVYEGELIPLKDENDISPNQEESKKEFIDNDIVESIPLESSVDDRTVEKTDTDVQDTRDLQSGDVIEKMKSRPLPPPPRPPRKTKDDFADTADDEEDGDLEVTDLDEEEVVVERIDILVASQQTKGEQHEKLIRNEQNEVKELKIDVEPEFELSHLKLAEEFPIKAERRKKSLSIPKTMLPPAPSFETSISTQTDTLPEGFYVEDVQQTTHDYKKSEALHSKLSSPVGEETAEAEKKVETVIEHKVVVIPTPETEILKTKKLHVEELEVEKLNVAELQAKKITVSDIDGVSMQVTELSSKSGHLVIGTFDLPSSFLESITPPPPPAPIVQIQSSTQTLPETIDSETNTTPLEEPLTTTPSASSPQPTTQSPPLLYKQPSPPPSIIIQSPQGQSSSVYVPGYVPTSPPPRSPVKTRSHGRDSEEELRILPRRRRHHSHKQSTQYSSDEDEEEYPTYPITRRSHQHEQTASDLIRQLVNIWQSSTMRSVNQVINSVNAAFPEGEKRKDAQTAACIVLVLIAGLIVLGIGSDRTVHHHHWDFLPPHP